MVAALAAASLPSRRSARAQVPLSKRAAVVIGVDRAGRLPRLSAAAGAAGKVADWLEREGFAVRRFLDSRAAVRVGEVYDAIEALVERDTPDQLVVYFGGHGFLNNYAEHWLLSHAPDNPNEAVSLLETVELARVSAIPSVVLISDACRSRADSLAAERVRGSLIFPNKGATGTIDPEVDRFLAAAPGDPALELPVGQSTAEWEAVFTASFLAAFETAEPELVRDIGGALVVPNRAFKETRYLERETGRRLQSRSLRLRQQPKVIIESGPTVFIGRARPPPPPPGPMAPTATRALPAILADVVARALELVGVAYSSAPQPAPDAVDPVALDSGFRARQERILRAAQAAPKRLQTESGIAVSGARVGWAAAGHGVGVRLYGEGGGDETAVVGLVPEDRGATSVLLGFAGGGGAVVAGLVGYIASVVVEDGRVVNVSHIPARSNPRWEAYQREAPRLALLRATVATAAGFGSFPIEGERETRRAAAQQVIGSARVLDGIDPALGLYAAYACAEAGLADQVKWLDERMRDLGVDLFDMAMLAGRLARPLPAEPRRDVVPFCPMLAQGWGLLRLRGVSLPEAVEEAGNRLRPALWTTFEEPALSALARALAAGRLL
jgi:hypothetical protein